MNESRPPSSVEKRPVSNREVPGSTPGEGSTFSGVWHYVIVRRELTGGALLAQVVHAAGESAASFGVNSGRCMPPDARAVVLVATKEQMQAIIDETEYRSDIRPWVITETDGPLAGSTTAIGFVTDNREKWKPIVGHLRPWRAP